MNSTPSPALPAPPIRDRHLELIIASQRMADSAIGLAMVTSWIPGIEVTHLDDRTPE